LGGIQFAVVLKAEEEIGGHCDERERLDGCVCVLEVRFQRTPKPVILLLNFQ
jgi:hypothetical protein